MKHNIFFKLLVSIPVILLILYYIPFLGICLLLFRYYIYSNKKYYTTPLLLLISSFLIFLPKGISLFTTYTKINIEIPYVYEILELSEYSELLAYSKELFSIAIILLIVSYILKNFFKSLYNKLIKYINKDYEISMKNDMKIKEKQLRSKNTKVIHCKKCGADNMISEKVGKCKYCRNLLK